MPSLNMKNEVSATCLTETKDLHICSKSKIISKKTRFKTMVSAEVAGIDTTIQNCLDVSSRTVSPKDMASCESIDEKEILSKEKSESQQQQWFSLDSYALESTNLKTAKTETFFSPAFECIEVNFQHYAEDAGIIGDTDMPGLRADESDETNIICGYETCDVSDFNISDMIFSSLPLDIDSFDDGICEIKSLSDYRLSEPTLSDASDQYMVLPTIQDDVKVGKTPDFIASEESMMARENASLYSALCQIRSCNQDSEVIDYLDKTEWFDPHLFIKTLPELSNAESNDLPTQTPRLSQRRKSVTLALDLDETLVHSSLEHCDNVDFTFTVFFNMKEHTVYVKKRPNLRTFLERVSEMFEVVIFTASQSIYAKQLLDILDPDGRFISRRVYRESCIFSEGSYTKDLTILGVDLAKVVIIDNSPQVFRLQVNNGIPIKSWFDDPLDCALMSLLPFLETLADADDVRPIIAQRFGNRE